MAFSGFGSTTAPQPFSFGNPATATTKAPAFSNFSFTAPTTTSAFGQTAAPQTTGFGLGTNTFGSGFGATPASTTTPTGFGGFGTATSSAPTGFGFGTNTTGTTGGNLFSGFGQQAAPVPAGFGSFGSSFGAKPIGSGTFGGFGSTSTPLFGAGFGQTQQQQQQQQQQQPANPYDAIHNAILNCNMFGDERDTTLARWNLLQALWGTGKGYYSQNAPPVEFTQQNPLCRFKAVGYSLKPISDNKEGLVALCFTKKVSEIRPQQTQLVTSLNTVLGNKPNLTVNVEGMKPLSDSKTQVVMTVQEKGATGSVRKIPATELAAYLLQPMQKQHLSQLGVDNVYPQVAPDEDQLKDYLENPPSGIDPRLWKQAIQDNPNPNKFIPVPMIGFGEVRWRMKCQEQETALHQAFLDRVAEEVQTLQQRQADTLAKTTEYRRKLVELEHRILQLLVKQEVTRKVGLALQPEEEAIRSHLETLQPHLYAPRQLKGRLAELLSTIRMQREKGELKDAERYTMNPSAQDEIKQFLSLQHKGMQVLVQTIRSDLADLKIMKDGMTKLLHRQ